MFLAYTLRFRSFQGGLLGVSFGLILRISRSSNAADSLPVQGTATLKVPRRTWGSTSQDTPEIAPISKPAAILLTAHLLPIAPDSCRLRLLQQPHYLSIEGRIWRLGTPKRGLASHNTGHVLCNPSGGPRFIQPCHTTLIRCQALWELPKRWHRDKCVPLTWVGWAEYEVHGAI